MTRATKEFKEFFKDYFIHNLSVEHNGKTIPVVSIWQAEYEWRREYERAETYLRLSMIELIALVVIVLHIIKP